MAKKKSPAKSKKSSFFSKTLTFIRKAVIIYICVTVAWVLLYRFINPPITWLMLQRGIERKFDGKEWKIEKHWLSFDELSNNLKLAAMAGEDARFLQHWGFDLQAIQKAYKKNEQGKKVRGGSTISQQTAKNVFLWPGRSWIRKGFEAYFTALIEIFWSKKRIMEVYLNVIEMGDGIYGADAATQTYYQKPATSLSKGEAAMLVAILPLPLHWTPKHPTRYNYYKQRLILRNMRNMGKVKF
ncbi:monofunctional biosynthetic peptidoglycan transglycosylase [Pedobacter sp. HMF7647]|uniref:Biosynthetic peptidoglycan transglycosylase n=1 Tax=Hufsiella arboris TaxID=2695275 RepID=A0A7K1YEI8_9SPHI|nr:monofunctional biosynthetic peptidoglycan transglycosylase [Hufsiella arboris]MXV53016.1 monofunctional biosynthetic peptidoglycan transglycosylase [Hufsiella arboris]